VTDAEKWYFMVYTLDSKRKPLFEALTCCVLDDDMKDKAIKVLGYILWLLEEAQKPVEVSRSGEREMKRVRSTGDLAGKNQIRI